MLPSTAIILLGGNVCEDWLVIIVIFKHGSFVLKLVRVEDAYPAGIYCLLFTKPCWKRRGHADSKSRSWTKASLWGSQGFTVGFTRLAGTKVPYPVSHKTRVYMWKAERGGSEVQGHLWLCNSLKTNWGYLYKILSQKQKRTEEMA